MVGITLPTINDGALFLIHELYYLSYQVQLAQIQSSIGKEERC